MKNKKNNPLKREEDVQKSNDEHIDQDFAGFPHSPAKKNIINPKTKKDRIEASIDSNNLDEVNEINSDGSANAFESSERTNDIDDDTLLRKDK